MPNEITSCAEGIGMILNKSDAEKQFWNIL